MSLLTTSLLLVYLYHFYSFYASSGLANQQQQVMVNGKLSSLSPTKHGVPKGFILSLTLFSLFTSYLLSTAIFLQPHAYAGDTIFYGSKVSAQVLIKNSQRHQHNTQLVVNEWHFCQSGEIVFHHNQKHCKYSPNN